MKLLITGAAGQLGTELRRQLAQGGCTLGSIPEKLNRATVIATDVGVDGMEALDITDRHEVMAFVRHHQPDVIVSFIGKNNIMALLTSLGMGIPVAVSVRGEPGEEYYNGMLRFLSRNLFRLADGVILQTKRCMEFFPQGIRKKAVILKNPVNPVFFREPYRGEREKTIVAVGRVDENKNHEMLIRAFAGIADEFPEYRLIIYGDGDKRSDLLKLTKELKLEDRISLPGNIDNVV